MTKVLPRAAEALRAAPPTEASTLTEQGELVIGRYVAERQIASGGMATVYRGHLAGLGGFRREVAIKRLHKHFAKDPEFVSMLLDEARLAARIVHPNVVPTLDVVTHEDEFFLVMDYVPGVALAEALRSASSIGQRMPVAVATSIVVGMLRGLHAAHEATDELGAPLQIVHRDVSPQNVLIGSDGVARLLDFGIAKAAVRLQTTQAGCRKGKAGYMAPEQITGGAVTRRTDIHAAAIVLWEALTGQRLHENLTETNASTFGRVLDASPRPPSSVVTDLPAALDAIALRGLARYPADRYATAREMADDLEARVGVATALQVAEWVAAIAGHVSTEPAQKTALLDPLPVTDSLGPTEIPTRRVSPAGEAFDSASPMDAPAGPSQVLATRGASRGLARRRYLGVIGLAFIAFVAAAATLQVRPPARAFAALISSAAEAQVTVPMIPPADATARVEDVSALVSAIPAPTATTITSATPGPTASAPVSNAPAPGKPKARTRPERRAGSVAPAACAPYTKVQGRLHFNPECL